MEWEWELVAFLPNGQGLMLIQQTLLWVLPAVRNTVVRTVTVLHPHVTSFIQNNKWLLSCKRKRKVIFSATMTTFLRVVVI